MSTLPVLERARKPGRIRQCPRCKGVGREGKGVERHACECCFGKGMVNVIEDHAAYSATQNGDLLDVGAPLDEFIRGLLPACDMLDGDVAVWKLQEDHGPRLVAVLTKGPQGDTVARWL